MPDKLTDEQILKALECLSGEAKDWDCDKCPFDSAICTSFVAENALYLINHQQAIVEKSKKVEYFADKTIATLQADNERLEVENQSLRGAANSLKMHYEEAQAEIERLKEQIVEVSKTIKSEAYKEFAERLKTQINDKYTECDEMEYPRATISDIDNLVKEMGDDSGKAEKM